MSKSAVIAIDGPSGSGKSTVAKLLAKELSLLYIDTGSMYRALALRANETDVDMSDMSQVENFLQTVNLKYGVSPEVLIDIDGENYSERIREHHVSKIASVISQIPSVRNFLVDYQRKLTSQNVCVMEGRDIGTIVFPNAFAKFFVTATVDVRAKRRYEQLTENGNNETSLAQVKEDVEKRDYSDINREHAPLKQSEDGILVDTSEMSLEEVIKSLAKMATEKADEHGISL